TEYPLPLPWPTLKAVLREILQALAHAHARGLVHLDMKPENCLLQRDRMQWARIVLSDFGTARRMLPRARAEAPEEFEVVGTPAFMSPEQTGKMNRAVDQRSDLYSLGATLYWLLTQRPPFDSDDVIELVHAHIARPPAPAREVEPRVPDVLSRIAATLLSKQSDERYQSATGLLHDLEACAEHLEQFGELPELPLRSRDLREVLTLPDALYGREDDVRTLTELVRRAGRGPAEVVFVSGYAGIGKSSLVGEVFRDVSVSGGVFVSGAAEQFQRAQPWGVVVQAMRELVRRIMAEPDAVVEQWRNQFLSSLGESGAVLTDVMPELELVLGEQPPVSALSPAETENRFRLMLQRLARALGRPDRPMAILLDDLQWADAASIAFVEQVATDPSCRHLVLIGAWRDNEVDAAHPLQRMLDRLRERRDDYASASLVLGVAGSAALISGLALLIFDDPEVPEAR
ncbi:MAG: AAA family ATPase, partial [Myxococcales bacterium]|nr:AAA family ATPase [Myxococcales bacterium]